MPQPLSDIIRRVRSKLDETSARLWTDTELTDYINDGCRDMARRAEDLLTFDTGIVTTPNIAKYPLPPDVVRIHRMEFVPATTQPGSPQTYPMEAKTYQEMDQVWGVYQLNPSSYPSFWVVWGYPGGVGRNAHLIQLYPVPSAAGTINLFYYRLPYRFLDPVVNAGELTKPVEVVEGWDDAVVAFAVKEAKQKDRDESWKDDRDRYEGMMEYLINVTRQWHDQQRTIMTTSRVASMAWLYSFDE